MAASLGSLHNLDALRTAHEQADSISHDRAVPLSEAVVRGTHQVDFAFLERVELVPAQREGMNNIEKCAIL